MYARFLIESDLPEIIKIFESQDTMYGVDIRYDRRELKDRLFDLVVNSSERQALVGAFEDEQLVGFVAIMIFREQPFWRTSLMFFNKKIAAQPRLQIFTGSVLFEFMTKYAETQGVYEFFYVVRDSGRKRFNLTLNATRYVEERYLFVDLKAVKPGEIPLLKFYRDLLGVTIGRNTKPVVIRQGFLKPEFRPDAWIS